METSDIIATAGVTILLIAFFLQSIKVLSFENIYYLLLNLIGAILTGYSSWMINFIPLVVLESVWAIVSLFNIFKYLKNNVSRENV